MTYLRKIAGNNEKILIISRPHLIYLIEGLLCVAGLSSAGFLIDYLLYVYGGLIDIGFYSDIPFLHPHMFIPLIPLVFSVAGFSLFWMLFLFFSFSEIGLTEERIIYKKGLFFVEVDQIDLDDVRAEHVMHGWLGWLLGYGKIHIDYRFLGDTWLPAISRPYRFVKAMHLARAKNPNISYGKDELLQNLDAIGQREMQHARPMAHVKNVFLNASSKPAVASQSAKI